MKTVLTKTVPEKARGGNNITLFTHSKYEWGKGFIAQEGNNMEAKDLLNIDVIRALEKRAKRKDFSKYRVNKTRKEMRVVAGSQITYGELWRAKQDKRGRRLARKKLRRELKRKRCPTHYKVYIKSKFWRKRRSDYFKIYGRKCEICGHSKIVQLHHKLYADYGSEKDENLVALCRFHHEEIHKALGKTKRDMIKETNLFISEMKTFQITYNRNKEEDTWNT